MNSSKRGFTLIELLVVIAIIALLMSILMPALESARQKAKNVICLANLKSTGTGMLVYANGYDDKLPSNLDPAHPFVACRGTKPQWINNSRGLTVMKLGLLYDTNIIENPKVFYCPATPSYLVGYQYESYCDPGPWGTLPQTINDSGTGGVGGIIGDVGQQWIRTGYSYLPQSIRDRLPPCTNATTANVNTRFPETAVNSSDISGRFTIVTDLIRNWDSLGHVNIRGEPRSLNALFGDGHVKSTVDTNQTGILNREYWLFDPDLPADFATNNRQMRPKLAGDSWDDERAAFHTVHSLFKP